MNLDLIYISKGGKLVLGGDEMEKMSLDMARCFPTEIITLQLENVVGQAMNAQRLHGIPSITSESGTPYPVRERQIRFQYEGIMNILKYFKVLPGEPVLADAVIAPKTYGFKASNAGIWHGFHELGTRVKKGEKVGEVTDLFGNVLESHTAPEDSKLFFLRSFASVNQGEVLFALAVLD